MKIRPDHERCVHTGTLKNKIAGTHVEVKREGRCKRPNGHGPDGDLCFQHAKMHGYDVVPRQPDPYSARYPTKGADCPRCKAHAFCGWSAESYSVNNRFQFRICEVCGYYEEREIFRRADEKVKVELSP